MFNFKKGSENIIKMRRKGGEMISNVKVVKNMKNLNFILNNLNNQMKNHLFFMQECTVQQQQQQQKKF